MHHLARVHLGHDAARIDFLLRDFRNQDWCDGVGPVDAVVTMQAAHEVRHRSRLGPLFEGVLQTLRPGGLFLMCDHYREHGSAKDPDLYLDRDEQPQALQAVGFRDVRTLLRSGGMALISARRP